MDKGVEILGESLEDGRMTGRVRVIILALSLVFLVWSCAPSPAPRREEPIRPTLESRKAVYTQRGIASWYGKKFHGNPTASGEIYDMFELTAAHQTLPLGTVEDVKNEVKQRMEVGKPGGGFIICTAHNIQVDTPIQNIVALVEAYHEYGRY